MAHRPSCRRALCVGPNGILGATSEAETMVVDRIPKGCFARHGLPRGFLDVPVVFSTCRQFMGPYVLWLFQDSSNISIVGTTSTIHVVLVTFQVC
jgi:hypothetical protein